MSIIILKNIPNKWAVRLLTFAEIIAAFSLFKFRKEIKREIARFGIGMQNTKKNLCGICSLYTLK